MTKIAKGGSVKGDDVSNASVLQRYRLDEGTRERAIRVLKIMEHNGELEYPASWVDDKGTIVRPWKPGDGSVLECWMDMLGLNGRPMNDTTYGAAQNSTLRHHLG